MKVMTEQFVLDGDKLTHTPTGATYWLGAFVRARSARQENANGQQ
jgi:hypothetical protein